MITVLCTTGHSEKEMEHSHFLRQWTCTRCGSSLEDKRLDRMLAPHGLTASSPDHKVVLHGNDLHLYLEGC